MAATATPSLPAFGPGGGGQPRIGIFSAEWCAGPQINLGGSDYWRLALPAAKLYEHGWDVKFARNLAETPGGRLAIQTVEGDWIADRDVIVIQRWMGEGTAERILRAREQGQVIVNEVDDDYWNFPEGHAAAKSTDPLVNSSANREHYLQSVAASSLITVSTPYLASQLRTLGPPVRVVRNYIDCSFWPSTPPGDYVGWVGGLPWRGGDIELLRETVVPWLRDRRQFFYHGGDVSRMGGGKHISERLGYDRVTTRPLAPIFNYPQLWDPLRVALVPIEDAPFGRSKSWIKGLEAAARGVPFVHSSHAEYEALGMGLCVREPDDWVRHLESLEDPAFYAAQVAANRAHAAELDVTLHWTRWAETYENALARAT
jgi:hypothetical protein